jgi:hypothetical protein
MTTLWTSILRQRDPQASQSSQLGAMLATLPA